MDRRISKAYNIIKQKYQQKLLLEDIANQVNLSPFHFQRLFKQEMKETPTACLIRLRLERAGHLLKSGNLRSMSEVAADCGFTSLSAFSRAFSAKYGMSPKAFSTDTASSMKIVQTSTQANPLTVEIEYFPDRYVFYNQTFIYNTELLAEFISAKSFCELNGIHTTGKLMGIMNHVTFHSPQAPMNYYAGVDTMKSLDQYSDRIFFLPHGKYAYFYTEESCQNVREIMMRFKVEWLDKSEYIRRDLFSVEEYLLENKKSDYPFFKRRIYVPIKHR
jgi:AraC-like DNA-binding protein/DNA gyrase inhibitor GyrI